MIEMRGADAYFLWEESPVRHMHTIKIMIVDPSTAHEKPTVEAVRRGGLRVLAQFPAFRLRPVAVPLGLGHPLWMDAPVLDPDYHVRHEVLPLDADEAAFQELVGRIASEPLDRSRPLWQVHLVEGLPGGRIAYVTKLHHAVADGSAAGEIMVRTLQQDDRPVAFPEREDAVNEAVPSAARRLAGSLRRELVRQKELPSLLRRSLAGLRASLAWRRQGRALPAAAFAAPPTRFNRALTPHRVYAHVALPLSTMKQVKTAFGCTINDLYLALVGGALRRYLEGHGDLPERPLTAAVPVSVRDENDDPAFGNATSYWFTTTGSDQADPTERLRAVAQGTRAARELFAARDTHLPVEWYDHWPLRRSYLDGLPKLVKTLTGRPSYNVIVSNVRGPSRQLYMDGARVEALRSMGPLTLQQGLNFTAWSYLGEFAVGLHACREHAPDLPVLAAALSLELEELRRVAAEPAEGARSAAEA